jgi:hypothetical protein
MSNLEDKAREIGQKMYALCLDYDDTDKLLLPPADMFASRIKSYLLEVQRELDKLKRDVELHERFDRDYDAQISENNRLKEEIEKGQYLLKYTQKIAEVQDKDIQYMKAKIEAANKLLNEPLESYTFTEAFENYPTYSVKDVDELSNNLKTVLQFPRKEPQELNAEESQDLAHEGVNYALKGKENTNP